ncbi:hypothetical protein GGX14DRAFT_677067 [Mycena pura]|uniref:F-box domain-containing protein n=1 Tax=Mycena pura TaxID=153505 RepID=A0AAD6UVF9_9AGAR|nr:hypothetical protein GGX14DRAFT_677067 [Mycena pura]
MLPIPPDLEQRIVHHVGAYEDLKSCALVSSRFCHWAQSSLFRDIIVEYDSESGHAEGCPRRLWIDRVRRLAAVVAHSPHLALYVRRLEVQQCSADVLAVLAALPFYDLHTVELKKIPHNGHLEVLDSFRKLAIRSPLRAIQLSFYLYPGDSEYLWDFAALCPPTLTSFDVRFCRPTRHEEPAPTPVCPPWRPRSKRPPKIRELRIEDSPDAVTFFNDPACPFDLNDVKQLQVDYNTLGTGLDSLLRRLGRTVESLKVYTDPFQVREPFDLSNFLALTHLDCCRLSEEVIVNVLERLPLSNRISHLRVQTSHSKWLIDLRGVTCKLGAKFEAAALRKLPHLQEVEMEILPLGVRDIPARDRTKVVSAVRLSMPRVASQGMLSISFVHGKADFATRRYGCSGIPKTSEKNMSPQRLGDKDSILNRKYWSQPDQKDFCTYWNHSA